MLEKPVKIFVARHAESIANTRGTYQGQSYDTDLSSLGIKQARALSSALTYEGLHLKGVKIKVDKIIASPLKRTAQTAEVVSNALKLPVLFDHRLLETNHGIWEGKNKDWIAQNYPEIVKNWQEKPSATIFPKGESFLETVMRVNEFIGGEKWEGNSLLITHDNIIRIMLCIAKRIPIDNIWKFNLEPAAITEFELIGVNGEKRLKIKRINRSDYLEEVRSDINLHAL